MAKVKVIEDPDGLAPPIIFPVEDKITPAEMRAAFRQDPKGIWKQGSHLVERDGQTVRKSGKEIRVEEGRAQQLAHSLGLPVPEVHNVDNASGGTAIVMEYVDGDCLEDVWPSMTPEQKQSIAEQIRDIIIAMRRAPYDQQNGIGSIGGPVYDLHRYCVYTGGPFRTEEEFNDFILDLHQGTPSLIRRTLADALSANHRIVFSHLDISPRNIIVNGARIQALIDWEYAGWYPEHWEFVKFFNQATNCRDWIEYVDAMFETQYPQSLLINQALTRWQRP